MNDLGGGGCGRLRNKTFVHFRTIMMMIPLIGFFSFVCFFVAFGESNKIKLFSPSTEGELLLFMMYAYMPCVKLAMF